LAQPTFPVFAISANTEPQQSHLVADKDTGTDEKSPKTDANISTKGFLAEEVYPLSAAHTEHKSISLATPFITEWICVVAGFFLHF
jgi:hypothetical protein